MTTQQKKVKLAFSPQSTKPKPKKKDNRSDIEKEIDEYFKGQKRTIIECLIWCTEHEVSDLIITEREYPYITIYKNRYVLPCTPITSVDWQNYREAGYIDSEQHETYVRSKMLDVSIEVPIPRESKYFAMYDDMYYRYRASYGYSRGRHTVTYRMIKPSSPTFNDIKYPESCERALKKAFSNDMGIIIFAGSTGSGKSTTMTACINSWNDEGEPIHNKRVISLEDPIENIFKKTDRTIITQKELGSDFRSYPLGIKQALRENPDIIVVGEMRDGEVMEVATEAAISGHMVVSTIHASSVSDAVARIYTNLDNNKAILDSLLSSLKIIVFQQLVKSENEYLVDTQYLLFTPKIIKKIRKLVFESDDESALRNAVQEMIENETLNQHEISKDLQFPPNADDDIDW